MLICPWAINKHTIGVARTGKLITAMPIFSITIKTLVTQDPLSNTIGTESYIYASNIFHIAVMLFIGIVIQRDKNHTIFMTATNATYSEHCKK